MGEQEIKDPRFDGGDPASGRTPATNRVIGLAWIAGGLAVLAATVGVIYMVVNFVTSL